MKKEDAHTFTISKKERVKRDSWGEREREKKAERKGKGERDSEKERDKGKERREERSIRIPVGSLRKPAL